MTNAFKDPSSKVRVLRASTKACAEVINLISASRVVLLDIIFNAFVEMQAILRFYRLGPKKTSVYLLLITFVMRQQLYTSIFCQYKHDRWLDSQ